MPVTGNPPDCAKARAPRGIGQAVPTLRAVPGSCGCPAAVSGSVWYEWATPASDAPTKSDAPEAARVGGGGLRGARIRLLGPVEAIDGDAACWREGSVTAVDVAAADAPAGRSVTIGRTTYPVVLPNRRDARLHTAAVVVTIHVLGQVALGFRVSVPQILAAALTCAVIEVALTMRRERRIAWPASALLTGSGVGLILRVAGTGPSDHWSTHRWWLFSAVAAGSLATKYLLRWRGTQVFNPSNAGLLVVFLALGRERVEPLDLWWHHLGWAMAIAYAAILVGGLAVTARLALLPMVAAFWLTLTAGTGVLAASGHCITPSWSLRPQCDGGFWQLMATSPEILVFLFFMITDPRTAPRSRGARAAFGAAVAVASLFLMAPSRTEFGTKVALFGGLVIVCAARAVGATTVAPAVARWRSAMPADADATRRRARALTGIGVAIPVALALAVVGLVAAGRPARTVVTSVDVCALPDPEAILPRFDPTLPSAVDVDPAVLSLDESFAGVGRARLVRGLLLDLAVEAEAARRGDLAMLRAVDHGVRLAEMRSVLARAAVDDQTVVTTYDLTALRLVVVRPGGQSGPLVAAETTGTTTRVTTDREGVEVDREVGPADLLIALRPAGPGRWLIAEVRPRPSSAG
jgi:hypothetical protein